MYICNKMCQFDKKIFNVGDIYDGPRTDVPSFFKKVCEENEDKTLTHKEKLFKTVKEAQEEHSKEIEAYLSENHIKSIDKLTAAQLGELISSFSNEE